MNSLVLTMRYPHLLLTLIVCLALSLPSHADTMSIYTLKLGYRSADELVNKLEPLLPEGGYITSHNNNLVIRTTSANYAELKLLVDELDSAPKSLMISVKQDSGLSTSNSDIRINGELVSRNGNTTSSHRNGTTTTTVNRSTGSRGNNMVHQVQALEGRKAWIDTGSQVPVRQYHTDIYGRPITEKSYQRVGQGFFAVAYVSDDRVNITLHSENNSIDESSGYRPQPTINSQEINTHLNGRIGQWLAVGVVKKRDYQTGKEIIAYQTGSRDSDSTVYIKVDVIDP